MKRLIKNQPNGGICMRRIISIILAISILVTFCSFHRPVNASTNTSIEEFAEDMSELYAEESADGKELEDSVACRVIVKATHQPNTYGYSECIVGNNNLYIYQYSDAETAQKAVEYYNGLPYVKWAELDGIVESQAVSYGNYMMQGDEAKEFVINSNVPTNEVVVAVLDTGASFKKDYLNNRVVDSGYNLSNSGKENSAAADNIHGTYVASIIVDNTSENIKVVAYKVLNVNGLGSNSSIALGIELAVDDGADVINMSLGGNEFSNAVYDAVKYAYSKGVVIVCAAGNEGADVSKTYPATFEEVFTVGSIDSKGHYSIFSNHGEEIDFVAPGHNIVFPDSEKDYGTSFSAPFVSAAVAMVLFANPELTINQAKNILIESAVPYESLSYYDGFHRMYGYESEDSEEFKEAFVEEYIEDESLYYGYGMPQIQNAIGITLGYEEAIKPEFSVESGTFHEAFEVTISAPEGYEIYYTTDETYPAKDYAFLYSSPIEITETQSIRAVAYSPDGMRSMHNTAEYRVLFFASEDDFTIDSDGYLTSYIGEFKEFIVPEVINGITVTGIGEYAIDDNKLRSIVLPETLTHIAEEGLYVRNAIYISAKGLKTVGLDGIYGPNVVGFDAPNIERIESMKLGIKSAYFPKLTEIGESAFVNWKSKEIYLPLITEVSYAAFADCRFLREVHLPLVTSVDFAAFSNCYWLKIVDMPNAKEFISSKSSNISAKYSTFRSCYNLVEVDFPNVEKIEVERLFEDCNHLEKVSLPKTQNICTEAFLECSRLTDIYIPNVQIIEDYAFAETSSLTVITLPNVKKLGDYVFKNSSLKKLNAPKLEEMGQYCFALYNIMNNEHSVNKKLTIINAPKLKTAKDYAFAYTGALTKLELPSLTDLGENAFLESSVSYLDAPMLKNASSLPTAENSIAILSSEFSGCSLDAIGYDLTIYGTYGTYAEAYANQFNLTFVGTPAIVLQPAPIYSSISETLETNAIGVNLTYQWYGADNPENLNGTAVEGATNKVFVPTDFESYPYYYCLVTSTDGDCIFEIKTNIVENTLHFNAADYTALEDAITKIPANLSVYTDESVAALNDILNSIDRKLNILQQKRVDEYVIALTEAIGALKLKSADYTLLNEVISKIPANLSIYTDESVNALNGVLNSIDKSLNITQQEQVDGYIIALTEAIEALKLKSADYTELEAAIAKIPVNLSIYTDESVNALNDVLNSIDKNLDITHQNRVDEYVIKVNNSVASLVLKSADYAELEIAIKAVPSDLSIYTDDSSAELKAILAEIDENLDITNQAQVDKWAEEIPIAIQKLILKPADYSALEKAIATIPSDLSVYTEESVAALQEIIDNIDYSLDITQQEQVDEYAEQINEAIGNLKEECWLIRLFRIIVSFFKEIILCFRNCKFKFLS